MGRIKPGKTAVAEGGEFALLPFLSTLRFSHILPAILFASVLSSTYYFTHSNKFNLRTSQNTSTILELVTAFVSTYSQQRAQNKVSHLPVPAVFKVLSLKLFDKQRSGDHTMHIGMVGVPGLAINTQPSDKHLANVIDRMAVDASSQSWIGYIGDLGKEVHRTIKPILATRQSCVDCHNTLQIGTKTWTMGDVLGAYVMDMPARDFFKQLRWETGMLGMSAFLFFWGSLTFFMRQQAHITKAKAKALQENQRSEMLAEARNQAEKETSKLTAQVRKAYEDLRLALKKERELNVLQRQFVSMASHEFRTPLAIIDGAAQRLERRSEKSSSEEITKRAQKIRGAVERMTRLMESTLMAASLDVEKLSINVGPCDIALLINEACLHQGELSGKHEISCAISELPETIQADPQALEQIVSNLLSNAIKYAPDAPEIDVKAYTDEDHVVLMVSDHGLGIDEEDLPRIFERFFRARTATGISGTGIGLNLIKILIELHDGSITIVSEAGKGSTFTVRLPVMGPDEVTKHESRAA